MEAAESGPEAIGVPGSPLHENPYVMQLQDFIAWVGGGPAPRSTPQDALTALQLALAVRESMRSGQPVHLEPLAEVWS